MQCNFPFQVGVSSSVSFTVSIDELIINISENHIVLRISFFMLAVCWCSTPFTASCVLRNFNGLFYCTCSSLAPLVPELCFWLGELSQNLNFLRCIHAFDLLLKFCSDLNEGIWLHFLFCFIVLMNLVSSVVGMSFFHLCFKLKFSRIALLRKRLQLDSKTDLITNGLWFFLLECASFRCQHCSINWNVHDLPKLVSFDDIKFFW